MRLAIVLVGASASAADEVAAPEGSELGPYAIVVIGDEDDAFGPALGNPGVVESVVPLGGTPVPKGHALLVHAGSGPVAADFVTDLRLEDADNLTVLLVRGTVPKPGADLELDEVGIALVWNGAGMPSEHVYTPAAGRTVRRLGRVRGEAPPRHRRVVADGELVSRPPRVDRNVGRRDPCDL